jgi:hypothetical protein
MRQLKIPYPQETARKQRIMIGISDASKGVGFDATSGKPFVKTVSA